MKVTMTTEQFVITLGGVRLDAAVSTELGISRKLAADLIADGSVTVNGKSPKKSAKVSEGDEITVILPDLSEPEAVPQAGHWHRSGCSLRFVSSECRTGRLFAALQRWTFQYDG